MTQPTLEPLSPDAVQAALETLPGWQVDGAFLVKTFTFPDFVQAFAWMTMVALVAEDMNHHPEWFNVYNRVDVKLQTHDLSPPQISQRDLELAEKMNRLTAGEQTAP